MAITQFRGPNEFLSNFYYQRDPITLAGYSMYTVEHAYQMQKTNDPTWQRRIARAGSPGLAKKLGRQCPIRGDWEDSKLGTMFWLLSAKFHPKDMAEKLVSTGQEELIEGNTWGDRYWGVCYGKGENHLGKLLMQLRDVLNVAKLEML